MNRFVSPATGDGPHSIQQNQCKSYLSPSPKQKNTVEGNREEMQLI